MTVGRSSRDLLPSRRQLEHYGHFERVAIGNSFGMTPQSGLPQNNRVGDIDPAAVPWVMRRLNLSADEASRQLANESGVKGVSGLSNDMRDVERAAHEGDSRAALALELWVAAARHWMGAYFLALNGADALALGLAENGLNAHSRACAGRSARISTGWASCSIRARTPEPRDRKRSSARRRRVCASSSFRRMRNWS
jgi:hypothetical protein